MQTFIETALTLIDVARVESVIRMADKKILVGLASGRILELGDLDAEQFVEAMARLAEARRLQFQAGTTEPKPGMKVWAAISEADQPSRPARRRPSPSSPS